MPYTPQQNGAAERENRTIVECARSIIYAANLPLKLWAEAVNTSVYVLNRTGPTSVKDKSPYELVFQRSDQYRSPACIWNGVLCPYTSTKKENGTKRVSKEFLLATVVKKMVIGYG
ncbi:integrase catalytic domain-containing protein [Trichonephila clavipes]|nr:integrase catalytic domain-containing protein [Trichonephila clavipes]